MLFHQCRELDEASVEVAAPDEGIRSNHFVEGFEVAHVRRIAIDDAQPFIVARHMHTEKLEGPVFLFGNEVSDDLVVSDVDASVLDDGNVVIVVVDADRLFNAISNPSL